MFLKEKSSRWSVVVALALVLVLAESVGARTPAGTQIMNQAIATYQSGGQHRVSSSNIVYVSVQQAAGVEVGPGEVQNRQVAGGQSVQHVYTVKNTGNAMDTFILSSLIGGDFNPTVTWYHDVGKNGLINLGDPIVNDISIGSGQTAHIIAQFTVPTDANPGDTVVIRLGAASNFDINVNDQSENVTFTVIEQDVVTAVLERDKALVEPGDDITYTIRVTNQTAETIGSTVVRLNIPEGTTAQEDSLVVQGVPAAGALPSSLTIEDLAPAQTAVVTYAVTIDNDALAGYITNQGWVQAGSSDRLDTNQVRTMVKQTAGVSLTEVSSSNGFIVNPTEAGHEYTFTYKVTNEGNGDDTFYIHTDLNTDWPVTLYQADGVTPLSQQNGEYNVGNLTAGGWSHVVVKVLVSAGVTSGSGPFNLVTTATSSLDPTEDAIEIATFDNIHGAKVTMTLDSNPSHDQVNPGETIEYIVTIQNDGPMMDVIELRSEHFPVGVTVEFFDGGGNPTMAIPLESGEHEDIYVRITIPSYAAPGDPAGGTVIGRSQNNPGVEDDVDITITVNDYVNFTVAPDRVGAVRQGSFAVYEFEITNEGNSDQTFTLTIDGDDRLQYLIIVDDHVAATNGVTINKGQRASVHVRVGADYTVAEGWTESVRLQATTDGVVRWAMLTTTVTGSELSMTKSADVLEQRPGGDIVYTVEATNISTTPLEDVVIYEAIPEHTVFAGQTIDVDPADVTIEYSVDGGISWNPTAPGNKDVTNVRWVLSEQLPVNDMVTVTVTVTVK